LVRLSAVHLYFSSTIRIQKCTGFKKSSLLRCLDDLQICSSKVFFKDNPDSDPKLRLKPDPNPEKIISDLQHWYFVKKNTRKYISLCKK
jgi:hypothetical protein